MRARLTTPRSKFRNYSIPESADDNPGYRPDCGIHRNEVIMRTLALFFVFIVGCSGAPVSEAFGVRDDDTGTGGSVTETASGDVVAAGTGGSDQVTTGAVSVASSASTGGGESTVASTGGGGFGDGGGTSVAVSTGETAATATTNTSTSGDGGSGGSGEGGGLPELWCGDEECNAEELCSTCPDDCGTCP